MENYRDESRHRTKTKYVTDEKSKKITVIQERKEIIGYLMDSFQVTVICVVTNEEKFSIKWC